MASHIELHGANTGNCLRAAIALDEAGVGYEVRKLDLRGGEQYRPEHRALDPSGHVPTLVDRTDPARPFVLTQSNAIMLYASDAKPGSLLPLEERARAVAFERFFYFVTDVIEPMRAAFLARSQGARDEIAILDRRAFEAVVLAERFVSPQGFIAGEQVSLADIAGFTIVMAMNRHLPWSQLPGLERWYAALQGRPAFIKGLAAFQP